MKSRCREFAYVAASAALIAASVPAGPVSLLSPALSQEKKLKEQLLGTWTLVSITATRPDGTKEQPFGADEGILMFDANGHYSLQLCTQGRPKYASNNRVKGTPEEYQATAQGCNTFWGRYTLNETNQALTINIEHAMFPNLEGVQQTWTIKITSDELRHSSPGAAGGTAEVIWRQAK
jgi:hypothetical protein